MTELADLLRRQIAATGPITVGEYMAACLFHPRHGYYTTRDPLGAAGDFTTAPEISQMFGELVGLALAQAWLDRGAPAPVALAELGPGRGTLMADILRATARVPGFHDAARPVLVEASPTLRARQHETLADRDIDWIDAVGDLPDLPLFLVANEFLDALPVRQFLRDGDAWRERLVGVADDHLTFALGPATAFPDLDHRLADTGQGDMVETSAAATSVAAEIGGRIARRGGVALLIDYGSDGSLGDTFQAVRRHEKEDPLATPGAADLTAHVDFAALSRAAPCPVAGPVAQGVWLERLGIVARARTLADRLEGSARGAHVEGFRRLTHPDAMGHLFKVMALHDDAAPPPGLDIP